MIRTLAVVVVAAFATLARADGADTYKAKCAMCHGADANGGAMYKKPIRGLAEADVLKMIKEGKGKMKPVQLSDDDAKAVAKFVAALKK